MQAESAVLEAELRAAETTLNYFQQHQQHVAEQEAYKQQAQAYRRAGGGVAGDADGQQRQSMKRRSQKKARQRRNGDDESDDDKGGGGVTRGAREQPRKTSMKDEGMQTSGDEQRPMKQASAGTTAKVATVASGTQTTDFSNAGVAAPLDVTPAAPAAASENSSKSADTHDATHKSQDKSSDLPDKPPPQQLVSACACVSVAA